MFLLILNMDITKTKVAVIGMGYVGFPLACAIARNKSYEVYGLDLDRVKIDKVNQKISPVQDVQAEKDIKEVTIFGTNDFSILEKMDFVVICVPTPVYENKTPDLTPVISATEKIAENLQKGQTIILESTVNPGVCEEIMLPILERTGFKGGIDFELAHCPERINPGDEKWNVYNIPRNVGALTKKGTKIAADFYRSFIDSDVNEVSSIKAAEATKIIENTFRDINIAYVNELAKSFDRMGIDILEVIRGASNKPFAFMPHFPGCGVGGHCIAVDPYYLIQKAEDLGFNHEFLKVARKVNNSMPFYTVEKLLKIMNLQNIPIEGATVGLLGLSYKANIGDLRESPSLEILEELHQLGFNVLVYDPYAPDKSNATLQKIKEEAVGVVVATAHNEFKTITDWGNIKIVVDGRNCLNMESIKSKGILYDGIGRGQIFESNMATPTPLKNEKEVIEVKLIKED
jgi:nucleotide sugar dehydrogenase